ncbi:MAG: hypothetical protein PVF82_13030 [Gammaproteobacteria bacterium]|jgi:hypothetical protein
MFTKFINKTQLHIMICLLAGLLSTVSLAAPPDRSGLRSTDGLPEYYPGDFQKTGILREVNTDDTVVISGLKYHLTANTAIHTTSNRFSSRWALKTGEEVGFTFSNDAANRRTISEIWTLPKGRVVSH